MFDFNQAQEVICSVMGENTPWGNYTSLGILILNNLGVLQKVNSAWTFIRSVFLKMSEIKLYPMAKFCICLPNFPLAGEKEGGLCPKPHKNVRLY